MWYGYGRKIGQNKGAAPRRTLTHPTVSTPGAPSGSLWNMRPLVAPKPPTPKLELSVFVIPDLLGRINLQPGVDEKQKAAQMKNILEEIDSEKYKESSIRFRGCAPATDTNTIKFLVNLIDKNAARVTESLVQFKKGPEFEHLAGKLEADRERDETGEEIMCGSRPKSMKVEISEGDESLVSSFLHFLRTETKLTEKCLNQDELNGKKNSITITYDADDQDLISLGS